MRVLKFVHWQSTTFVLGYLVDYPDYWTQGETLEELRANLVELLADLESGEIPGIRHVEELIVP